MACEVLPLAMFLSFLCTLVTATTRSLVLLETVFTFLLFYFSSVLSLLCTPDGLVLELKYSSFFNRVFSVPTVAQGCSLLQ